MKKVEWEYPYQRFKNYGWVICAAPGRTEADLFSQHYNSIANGSRIKTLYDCTRGLIAMDINENDDPSKVSPYPVMKGTNFSWYREVCRAVTHAEPYLPE